jgi:hypothetical protein
VRFRGEAHTEDTEDLEVGHLVSPRFRFGAR